MSLTTLFTINDCVIYQPLDGQAILLNAESGKHFGLDAMSAMIWELMQDVNSLEPIYSAMLEHFELEEGLLMHDLQTFWQQLLDYGLIEVGSE